VSHVPEPSYAGVYRYVPHTDVPAMEAQGWQVVGDMPGHHKFWSVIMKWAGDGEPITTCRDAVGIVPTVNGSTIESRT
jgi:hypothetical protein